MTNGQTAELIALFAKKVTLDMPDDVAQGWIDNPRGFGKAINELLVPPPKTAMEAIVEFTSNCLKLEPLCKEWSEFYSKFFSLDIMPETLYAIVPKQVEGFSRLIVIPQGLSINKASALCRQHFKCWKYVDDLEAAMQESERGPAKQTTARWFRDRVEADEETKNKSARDLQSEGSQGITLLERIVLELKYFSETGKHLDIDNWTLCSGSRYAGGRVPCAYWDGDGSFRVYWYYVTGRSDGLRSRVAVG